MSSFRSANRGSKGATVPSAATRHQGSSRCVSQQGAAKYRARARHEFGAWVSSRRPQPFPAEDLRDGAMSPTDLACLWLAAENMDDAAAAGAARRQLSLQQRAVEQLRALAKPYRFRVQA